jgi:lipopolysaccharide assembly protein A
MQTLRTIIWAFIAATLALFAAFNWQIITVAVWPGYSAELPLPLLIIASFLLGFLPPFIVYVASRARARRTIVQQVQVINDLRMPPAAVPAPVSVADPTPDTP